MLEDVIHNDRKYAIFGDVRDLQQGTTFIGDPHERLQFSVLKYNSDKILQSHVHLFRQRIINRTQESWICLQGKALVKVYDDNKNEIYRKKIIAGQFFISYSGGHGYEILEDDTIVIENKLGDFIGVEEDKEKF